MWFIGVEVEQETSAPLPKKNPGSAPVMYCSQTIDNETERLLCTVCKATPKPDASIFLYRKYTTRLTLPHRIQ